ncbi:hypothetical protein fep_066 [Pigeonpox virus]|uniref:Uncharacterized protein n=1 Tax=Pigeonpox virus TaxID=10264 RepID=A0A068EKP6_9POXV|nr:hypothetical protein HM89_gp068 [Pigeonpox virus]AID46577.1 hypothetical protein fep_066 [Pigeonpox virus]WCL40018.1 hypothetical protein [Pigeonpox virus]
MEKSCQCNSVQEYQEMMSIDEVNDILKHDGISPCYFGECKEDILKCDVSEYNIYNIYEISGLYTKFLEDNYLNFIDTFKLDDDVLDHIMYHFTEYLSMLKNTVLSRKAVCKRILNKDIYIKNKSHKPRNEFTYNNRKY